MLGSRVRVMRLVLGLTMLLTSQLMPSLSLLRCYDKWRGGKR